MLQIAMIELTGRHITDKLSSPRKIKKQAWWTGPIFSHNWHQSQLGFSGK